MSNEIWKEKLHLNQGLWLVFSLILLMFYSYAFCSGGNARSGMNAQQLKELGKQELAKNQYSDAIKTYTELKKRFPNDPIYTVQGELFKSIIDPATFDIFTTYANQTTFNSQTTLAGIKLRIDAELVADSDNPSSTIFPLNRLSRKYEELGDYEKALGIITEIRKAYVDEPWTEAMLKKLQATGAPTEPKLTGDYVHIGFDMASRLDIARLLQKQGKSKEAKEQYQKVLSIVKDDKIMGKISVENRQKLKDAIEKRVTDGISALQ
jgi:tetratricopeptide (TPR) repeat protein